VRRYESGELAPGDGIRPREDPLNRFGTKVALRRQPRPSKDSWYPYFVLTKKTSKNQITLPKRIADQFPAVDYFEVTAEAGKIILRPVDIAQLLRVREKLAELGLDEDDIRAAVAWARRPNE
jgi:hypothetical protein